MKLNKLIKTRDVWRLKNRFNDKKNSRLAMEYANSIVKTVRGKSDELAMLLAALLAVCVLDGLHEDILLKKEIGQMLMVGFKNCEFCPSSPIARQIKELNLGGVILFDYDVPSKSYPRNIVSPNQTKKLIDDLKNGAQTPMFIALDAEGGYINRLKEKYGFERFSSHQELGNADDPAKTYETAKLLGEELAAMGFNLDFAPVVDLNINPENPVIGGLEISFSDDPEKVTIHALAFINGLHENGIISAIKHFPGHGSSQNDSHLGIVDITKTYEEKELEPYANIFDSEKTDMVMTAHVINSKVDPEYPATLSPLFLEDILRKKLGYDGVIVSDDMQMGAITEIYGFEESLFRSINAGCDLIILSNNGETYDPDIAYRARNAIFEAVKKKEIPRERIEESCNRIMKLKKRFGLVK